LSKIFAVLAGVVIGYIVGATVGAGLIQLLSANAHDKSVEMAMTAAFVTGPIGALIGVIAALVSLRRRAPRA